MFTNKYIFSKILKILNASSQHFSILLHFNSIILITQRRITLATLIDFILHIDVHLIQIVNQFGDATYLILFAIIFIETGAVIMPFLPGDSLLFAASALAADPRYHLNIWIFIFRSEERRVGKELIMRVYLGGGRIIK